MSSKRVDISPEEEQKLIESGERDLLTKDDDTIEDGRKILSRAINNESNTQEVIVRTNSIPKAIILPLIQLFAFPTIYYLLILTGLYLSGSTIIFIVGLVTAIYLRQKLYKKYRREYIIEPKYTALTRYYQGNDEE